MKRVLSVLLAFVLLLGCLSCFAYAADDAEETKPEEVVTAEEQIAAWESYSAAAVAAAADAEAVEVNIETVIQNASNNSTSFKEVEPNNTMSSADRIYNDYTVSGTMPSSDYMDFFKIVLPTTSKVTISSLCTKNNLLCGIFDTAEKAKAASVYVGKYEGYYAYYLNATLPAGTYYVVTLKDVDSIAITYAFTINWESSGSTHTHNYVESAIVAPTCTTDGYTVMKCSCGDSYNTNYVSASHNYVAAETVAPGCASEGYTVMRCTCGDTYTTNTVPANGNHLFTDHKDTTCENCSYTRTVTPGVMPVYRLYNPYTYEHLLTSGDQEKYALVAAGWHLDGLAWNAPENGIPVYRLYNRYDNWHTYTTDTAERDAMVAAGWSVDGVVSSGYTGPNGKPIYRLFNPYVQSNFHLFTAGIDERDNLVNAGWWLEGVAWMALN